MKVKSMLLKKNFHHKFKAGFKNLKNFHLAMGNMIQLLKIRGSEQINNISGDESHIEDSNLDECKVPAGFRFVNEKVIINL
jgi:hypothetical protein